MRLILASSSPRRKEILTKFGYKFEIDVPDINEAMSPDKTPYQNVMDVSMKKAQAVASKHPDEAVLACDTVVCLDGVIYGKPHSYQEAFHMIKKFSNREHEVVSGVSIIAKGNRVSFYTASRVKFKALSDAEIEEYVSTKEPYDKAGGYAIQGDGRRLIDGYTGSLYNIIGLPIEDLKKYLDEILGE